MFDCLLDFLTYLYAIKHSNDMSNDNSNANVVKNDTEIIRYSELTTSERTKLNKATTGHGKLKAALSSMGLSPLTVRRAAAGMKVTTDSADKIRTFLHTL